MTDQSDEGTGPYLYLLVTMVLFGTAFTGSKVVVGQLPHQVAAMLRFGGGAVVLALMLCVRRNAKPFSWREVLMAGAVGLVGVFTYNIFFFWAISLAPAIDGSVIVPVLSPVLTNLALLLAGRERASTLRVTGLAVGIVGAVVFFVGIGGASGVTGPRVAGDFLYLFAAACWAAYSIASKKVLRGIEPLRATTYATGAGALALALTAIPSLPATPWSGIRASTWANVAFLAIGPTAIAYLSYYRALRSVSPVTATITMFSVPVFGSIASVLFLHESFTTIQVVGALVTIAGALLAVTRGRPAAWTFRPRVSRLLVARCVVRCENSDRIPSRDATEREAGALESIAESVDVDVPVGVAYRRWNEITSFPQYMDGVDDVRTFDSLHSHWVTSAGGFVREFDATITDQEPGQRIAWTCDSGPMRAGSVTFEPLGADRTTISVELDLDPQGLVENFAEKSGILHRMVVADLYRFKEAVEAPGDQGQDAVSSELANG